MSEQNTGCRLESFAKLSYEWLSSNMQARVNSLGINLGQDKSGDAMNDTFQIPSETTGN